MILTTLALSNFTVFKEHEEIQLAPDSSSKPLIVIDGHNGSGKTSILTAIQLSLFGKRIVTELGERIGYADYLEGLSSDKSKDSSVSLEFKIYTLGKEDIYKVVRRWGNTSKNRFYEELAVYKNSERDSVLETAWDDFIDTVIPIAISNLFFFDGEKIAEMATEEGICELLKTGIHSLLGINTLNQLHSDLGYLIKYRIKTEDLSMNTGDSELCDVDKEIDDLSHQIDYLRSEISNTKISLDEYVTKLHDINRDFEKTGAKFFYERKQIELEHSSALKMVEQGIERLHSCTVGVLPLALLHGTVRKIYTQAKAEKESSTAKYVSDALFEWKDKITSLLKSFPAETVSQIDSFFHSEEEKYKELIATTHYLNLPGDTYSLLEEVEHLISKEKTEADSALSFLATAQQALESSQRLKAMIPSEDSVKDIIAKREMFNEHASLARDTIAVLERKAEQTQSSLNYKKQEQARLIKKIAQSRKAESIEGRTIRYAQKAQQLLQELTSRVIEHSRSHLELLIQESLQALIRKRGFIRTLRITDEFSLQVHGYSGEMLDVARLSAGERQLIVISILWGLTKASGRPLPFIIDTPLGRLDSKHRENLLEFYFPDASHQTILLATDTEITPRDYEKLSPFISKNYSLQYDDATKMSHISVAG